MKMSAKHRAAISKGRKRVLKQKAKENNPTRDAFGEALAALSDAAYARGFEAGTAAALEQFRKQFRK